MRQTPPGFDRVWRSGDFIGANRPVVRVTVQHPMMKLHNYNMLTTHNIIMDPSPSGTQDMTLNETRQEMAKNVRDPLRKRRVRNTYANFLFGNQEPPKEIPAVKSLSWDRTIDADVASATLEIYNVEPMPVGASLPVHTHPLYEELDQRGYYTPNRGAKGNPWNQHKNTWFGLLRPDNIIRTYEGYGSDWLDLPIDKPGYIPPEGDSKLMQTGVWMIDRCTIDAVTGTIQVSMRDVGRLLIDQYTFPGVVPKNFYPVKFRNWDEEVLIGYAKPSIKQIKATPIHQSNVYWYDGLNTPIFGHKFKDAFDERGDSYWLSIGNSEPSKRFAYEYIEVDVHKANVNEVRFRAKKHGYTAYVSVKVDGVWQGTSTMNYHRDGIGKNDANIPYVKSCSVPHEREIRVQLPKTYKKVQRVRLTFSNLQNFGVGTFHYRAGIREMTVWGGSGEKKPKYKDLPQGPTGSNPGRYRDYTDIVLMLCAWAGFYWPRDAYVLWSDGTKHYVKPKPDHYTLGSTVSGRVWADFMRSRTNGPNELGVELFDKKSLMECVQYVVDVLGFVFFIDETGGVQFRMPNLYKPGNWLIGENGKGGRSRRILNIDDQQVIINASPSMDSSNVSEGIFVSNKDGSNAAYVGGFNPNQTGMRRTTGYTDAENKNKAQAVVMAEMIAVRRMFTYYGDTVRIPGNPAIQIDDHIRINERVTGNFYLHYVKGVSSSLDMETGVWTYTLQLNWLGDRIGDTPFEPQIRPDTKRYMEDVLKQNPFTNVRKPEA